MQGQNAKLPVLNEVPLSEAMPDLMSGKTHSVFVAERWQWDGFLRLAYCTGSNIIELDKDRVPVRAYRQLSLLK